MIEVYNPGTTVLVKGTILNVKIFSNSQVAYLIRLADSNADHSYTDITVTDDKFTVPYIPDERSCT